MWYSITSWELWLFWKERLASNTYVKLCNLTCHLEFLHRDYCLICEDVRSIFHKNCIKITTTTITSPNNTEENQNQKLLMMGWLSDKGSGFVGKEKLHCSCKYDNTEYQNPVGNHILEYTIIYSNLDCVRKHLKGFQCHSQAGTIRQMQSYLYHFQCKCDKKKLIF